MSRPDQLHHLKTLRDTRHALLLGALALVASCGEGTTTAVSPTTPAEVAMARAGGNSLNAKSCQKNGWKGLVTSAGASFASEEACVSYAAKGGTLYQGQAITFAALAGKTFGDADFAVSATASSGLPVTFTAAGDCTVTVNSVHLTGAGSCTITAHQVGDATWFAAADVAQSFAIAKGAQSITFGALGGKTFGDADFAVSATASSGLTVTFGAAGGCTITGNSVHITDAGLCTITASQAGDANWNAAADVPQAFTTAQANQTISFTSANPSPANVGSTYTPTATATSGLTVAISLDGTSTGCSIASGVVSFASAGTCVVNANQAGDNNYNAAAQVQHSITINAPQISAGCAAINTGIWNAYGVGTLFASFQLAAPFTLGEVIHVSLTVVSGSTAGASFTIVDQYPSTLFTLSSGNGPVSSTFTGTYTIDNGGLVPDVMGLRASMTSGAGVTVTSAVTCTAAP